MVGANDENGMERMEWHQTHGNHVFSVVDTIPPIPLPAVTTSASSPIKGLPTSCGLDITK